MTLDTVTTTVWYGWELIPMFIALVFLMVACVNKNQWLSILAAIIFVVCFTMCVWHGVKTVVTESVPIFEVVEDDTTAYET